MSDIENKGSIDNSENIESPMNNPEEASAESVGGGKKRGRSEDNRNGGKKLHKKRHVWRTLFRLFLFFMVAGVGIGWELLDVANWQKLDVGKILNVQQISVMYDINGDELMTLQSVESRSVVNISQIPEHVRNAFIAAEDLRFYTHPGFDPIRMAGSVVADIKSGSLSQGASTITQQLIKLSHLTAEKTFTRKFQEIWLAWNLERQYSKDEILGMYLNYIYFGNRAYGIQQAAREYFHKDVWDLTPREGAMLAATIKAPSYYAPHLYPENNKARADYVLRVMYENDMLDEEAYQNAIADTPEVYVAQLPTVNYGWFVDQALADAETLLGVNSEALLGGGYHIYTTLDPTVQKSADETYANKSNFAANASDGTPVQSAFAVVDVKTGAILALEGGREYTVRRALNRATQARRSPGSSIKPLVVYGPAIKLGYSTASILLDEQGDFGGYAPRNSGNHYYGPTTMRTALARSLNVATVRLLQEIGVSTGRDFLTQVGIPVTDNDWGLSLALGSMSKGVTPLELASAYAMFGNKGVYNAPFTITKIIASDETIAYEHEAQPVRVLSEQNAYLMTSLLQSVTSWGTGSRLSSVGIPVAGKTGTNSIGGTSGGNRDVWMATYTVDYATACWMGFDVTDNTHKIASWESGGSAPATLTAAFYKKVYAGKKAAAFPIPDGIVGMTIDTKAVAIRGEIMLASDLTPEKYQQWEVFLSTNRPTRYSDVWQAPRAPGLYYIESDQATGMPRLVFTPTDTATLRINRSDPWGGSVVMTEVYGRAGQLQTYTDYTAQAGIRYTYSITPINAELMDEGIYLEGQAVRQSAQVFGANDNLLDDILGLWN
ncbi:MAG: PBP1A family penicillin-binding protein [Oscillospiraceae bacterium]|jgi:1A family penicillin-binding protein|nr:PBP1A family penicillin-binding protein [Oscillospiraceae bacterium]